MGKGPEGQAKRAPQWHVLDVFVGGACRGTFVTLWPTLIGNTQLEDAAAVLRTHKRHFKWTVFYLPVIPFKYLKWWSLSSDCPP